MEVWRMQRKRRIESWSQNRATNGRKKKRSVRALLYRDNRGSGWQGDNRTSCPASMQWTRIGYKHSISQTCTPTLHNVFSHPLSILRLRSGDAELDRECVWYRRHRGDLNCVEEPGLRRFECRMLGIQESPRVSMRRLRSLCAVLPDIGSEGDSES